MEVWSGMILEGKKRKEKNGKRLWVIWRMDKEM
jgi:hypothetical protein